MVSDETIRRAGNIILTANHARMDDYPLIAPISVQASRQYAYALAEAGLLAPASLQTGTAIWDAP